MMMSNKLYKKIEEFKIKMECRRQREYWETVNILLAYFDNENL